MNYLLFVGMVLFSSALGAVLVTLLHLSRTVSSRSFSASNARSNSTQEISE
jgi:hypothetical protein